MIDSEARKETRAISESGCLREGVAAKVAYYGLVGRSLNPDFLPEKLILSSDFCTFNRIEELLSIAVKEAADEGFFSLDKETQRHTAASYGEHRPEVKNHAGGVMNAACKRLEGGSGMAAAIETITLRTIARKQSKGELVTREGLDASVRVPMSIAMMHISDMVISKIAAQESIGTYFGHWYAPNGHDSGYVFLDTDTKYHPRKGLYLTELHDGLAPESIREDWGPHIGCPAMLNIDFFKKTHSLAVDAVLEAGLITLS